MAKRIGELLVEAGVLSQSQLEQALFAQRKDGRKLGQLLIELGLVSEIQLTQTLSRQLSVPWVSLYHIDFSRSLLNLVAREIAEKYLLVPIFVRRVRKQGDTLYVAMDDPTNDAAIEEAGRASGLPVKPMIACPSDILAAIRVYYLGESASTPPKAMPGQPPVVIPPQPGPRPLPSVPAEARDAPEVAPPKPPAKPKADAARPATEARAPTEARHAPAPPPSAPAPTRDSADSAPDVHASETGFVAPPRMRPKMISLTLLDGTHISIPAPVKEGKDAKKASTDEAPARPEFNSQLTARDFMSALRAVAHGVDASEILGSEPRWEALFSALLSIMLRKGLIADWEFVEEFRKI